jgi:hypothetical protein
MWGDVQDRDAAIERAKTFTGDHVLYGSYMRRVAREWPISCENSLTDSGCNRKAWIGHAAVALALQIPEDIVRQAWGELTNEQRLLANEEARRTIAEWERGRGEGSGIREDMGDALLLQWDTGRGSDEVDGLGQGAELPGDCDCDTQE